MRYSIAINKDDSSFRIHLPDMPGGFSDDGMISHQSFAVPVTRLMSSFISVSGCTKIVGLRRANDITACVPVCGFTKIIGL
ncbi:hypothetical protein PT300_01390 [Enterobacteriaceae bacterium ESL0689]|nr:hypothetical protein [Enterobacteriaceae bacterium ESL0689]